MSHSQDVLLIRGYCYLVQRTYCDERDYSDYTDPDNHEHLSVLGCYSTLDEANRRAKAEARRLLFNMGRANREEIEDDYDGRGFYGATVYLRDGLVEKAEFTIENARLGLNAMATNTAVNMMRTLMVMTLMRTKRWTVGSVNLCRQQLLLLFQRIVHIRSRLNKYYNSEAP